MRFCVFGKNLVIDEEILENIDATCLGGLGQTTWYVKPRRVLQMELLEDILSTATNNRLGDF